MLLVAAIALPQYAYAVTFTDDPVVAGVNIRAVHITELRNAVNAAREKAALPAATFTDSLESPAYIKRVHVEELRDALDEARASLGFPPMAYTDPVLAADTPVKAAHIQQLREAARVVVDGCHPITITNPSDATFTSGRELSAVFTQSGALNGVTFAVASGTLPEGVVLSPAGDLSGTPTENGSFPITVRATDGYGCTGTGASYALEIVPEPTVVSFEATGPISSDGTITLTGTFSGGTGMITNNRDADALVVTSGVGVHVTPSGDTTYMLTVTNAADDGVVTTIDYVAPALLRINEVNANVAGNCDQIELRVLAGGSMAGIALRERTGAGSGEMNYTFPSFVVQKNDIIVLHVNSGSVTCNPGGAIGETVHPAEQAQAIFSSNYDTAYDHYSDDQGLTATDNVFTIRFANGTIIDALLVSDDPFGTSTAAASETAALDVLDQGEWVPAGVSYVDGGFRANAADDLNATGITRSGTTIQRIDDTDDNDRYEWTTGAGAAHTWGLLNVGQTPF